MADDPEVEAARETALRKKRILPPGPHPIGTAAPGYTPGYANPEDVPPCRECGKPVAARVMPGLSVLNPSFASRYFPADCQACKSAHSFVERRRDALRSAEERAAAVARSVSWNPIPELFAGGPDGQSPADLDTMAVDAHNRQAHAAARRLVADMQAQPSGKRVRGFGMYGGKGGGKSHVSYAIVRALRQSGIAAVVYTLPALDRAVRGAWGDKVRERELHALLVGAPLLVIDDMGKERKTAEENMLGEFFCEVIDDRVLATLPVVVSTNFSPHDLEFVRYAGMDRFGAAIDRLTGIFGSEWIAVSGASRRG